MRTSLVSLRPWLVRLAIPVGGLAVCYTLFIDWPLRQQVIEAKAKATKLNESVKKRGPDHAANLRTLTANEKALSELTKLVASASSAESSVTTQPMPVDAAKSPLSRLSAALALLAGNEVHCLASEPIESASEPDRETGHNSANLRRLKITLDGSFANMHRAIAQIEASLNSVVIESLEMHASQSNESEHQWTMVLRI